MLLYATLGLLTLLSLVLTIWQWLVGWRFPLHQRVRETSFLPPVTLLKPLKGSEPDSRDCLRSWMTQDYSGQTQVLFGVASPDDPVCPIVRELIEEHPQVDARLIICSEALGANAKVSTLIQLQRLAQNEVLVISDADVKVPSDFLRNVVSPLAEKEIGLINCFYSLANPNNTAMRWEAVAINSDFWSQVLQSKSLKPIDFALGAVMATTQTYLNKMGGFQTLANYLADDYQLGHLIYQQGGRIVISPVTVECWSAPMTFREVWKHQLRWSRTIRICQPAPYFFSILSNATLWPLLWLAVFPSRYTLAAAAFCWATRVVTARSNQQRLAPGTLRLVDCWVVLIKDILQVLIWGLAFLGNHVEWRGKRYRVLPKGELAEITS